MNNVKRHLKELLSKNKYTEFFEFLERIINPDSMVYDTFIVLLGAYNQISSDIINGLSTWSSIEAVRFKNEQLLTFINSLSKDFMTLDLDYNIELIGIKDTKECNEIKRLKDSKEDEFRYLRFVNEQNETILEIDTTTANVFIV